MKSRSKTKRTTARKQFIQNTIRMLTISTLLMGIVGIFYTPAFIIALALAAIIGTHFIIKIIGYVSGVCCGDTKYSISLEEIIADLDRTNG